MHGKKEKKYDVTRRKGSSPVAVHKNENVTTIIHSTNHPARQALVDHRTGSCVRVWNVNAASEAITNLATAVHVPQYLAHVQDRGAVRFVAWEVRPSSPAFMNSAVFKPIQIPIGKTKGKSIKDKTIFDLTDDKNIIANIIGYLPDKTEYEKNTSLAAKASAMIDYADHIGNQALVNLIKQTFYKELAGFFNE